jgi:hypothetical protein
MDIYGRRKILENQQQETTKPKKKIFKAILLNYEIEDSNSGKPYECVKICQLSF